MGELDAPGKRYRGSRTAPIKPVAATRGAAEDFRMLPAYVQEDIVALAKGEDVLVPSPAAVAFVRRYPGWQPGNL